MTTYIFIKELRNYLLNRSIPIAFGLIIVLFVLNASIHVFQYQELHQNHKNNVAMNDRNLTYDEEQNIRTLPEMVHIRQKIHHPSSSLSFISNTAEGLVPDGVSMKMFEELDFESFGRYNPHTDPHLSIDWTTIMIYVISFLCICFSYNAFSGEREDGTLMLMLSNNLSRSSIIFAKYLGLLVVFLIPILIGIMISCLIFELSPAVHLTSSDYAKIGCFFFVSALMVSVTVLLGFSVSSLTRNSYTSLIICLLCWTLLVIVIPNTGWIITEKMNKIPALTAIELEEEQQKDALKDCYMGWKGDNSTEETARDRKDCIDRRTVIHNDLWSDYHNMQITQTNKAVGISKFSPFGLFRFLNDKISGNNFHGYVHFFKQVKNYQSTFRDYVIGKDNADPESRHLFFNDFNEFYKDFMSRQQIVPEEVPQFIAQPQTFRELAADSIGDIAILCFWIIGLFILSYVAFIRYDVR